LTTTTQTDINDHTFIDYALTEFQFTMAEIAVLAEFN